MFMLVKKLNRWGYTAMMTFMELVEIATPYDEGSHCKDTFIQLIRDNPQLEDAFNEKYTDEFEKEVQKKGIAFILNNVSAKRRLFEKNVKLSLYYCGMNETPVISIDY